MNEIIQTIWLGAPWVILAWVFIALIVLYCIILEWRIDYSHVRLTWLLVMLPLFIASVLLCYFVGGVL